jgi:hypothetical protein
MKTLKRFLASSVLVLAAFAFAQEVAAPPAPLFTTDDASVVTSGLSSLLKDAKSGRIALAVVSGIILVTQLVLRFGARVPGKVGEALRSPWAKWILPQVLSVAGAIGTSLGLGQPLSVDLVLSAVLLGLAGGGLGPKSAQAAEEVAAAADTVKTPADAVKEMNIVDSKKGPNP